LWKRSYPAEEINHKVRRAERLYGGISNGVIGAVVVVVFLALLIKVCFDVWVVTEAAHAYSHFDYLKAG